MSQGNATFKAESWKDAVGVPLPSDEASFLNSRPELREAFTDNGRMGEEFQLMVGDLTEILCV
jgi:hypothetical protein